MPSIDPELFDAQRAWRLHHRVALRPEPFGAMAYHYDNRRLNFLRSPDLVRLVETLENFESARSAFDALGLDSQRWPAFERALASLAVSDFLETRSDATPDQAEPNIPNHAASPRFDQ